MIRGRRTSTAGATLDNLFLDLRVNEGKLSLVPIIRNLRASTGVRDGVTGPDDITRKDLQGLAIAWKLPSSVPSFWADNPTDDDLVAALYRHSKRLREQNPTALHLEPKMHRDARSRTAISIGASEAMESKPDGAAFPRAGYVSQKATSLPASAPAPEDWRCRLGGLKDALGLPAYRGDLFGTRGAYHDALIYNSRGVTKNPAEPPAGRGRMGAPGATVTVGAATPSQAMDAAAAEASNHAAPDEKLQPPTQQQRPSSGTSARPESADPDAAADGARLLSSHDFDALRLSSTATLVDIAMQSALRDEISDPASVQTMFDTWRQSAHPQIRRNCALTLAHLYACQPMIHDDLLLPILGLCTSDSALPELQACTTALCRRTLQGRLVDILFVPSLLTAAMALLRRDGTTARMRAEAALLLLQVLDLCIDNDGQGATDALIFALSAVVTGGLTATAAGQQPGGAASPAAKGAPSSSSSSSPPAASAIVEAATGLSVKDSADSARAAGESARAASPRRPGTSKKVPRAPSRGAVITAEAIAAASEAASVLSRRDSFRLMGGPAATAPFSGGAGSFVLRTPATAAAPGPPPMRAIVAQSMQRGTANDMLHAIEEEAAGASSAAQDSPRAAAVAGDAAAGGPHRPSGSSAPPLTAAAAAATQSSASSTTEPVDASVRSTLSDPHLAVRVALEYGLLQLTVAMIRSCQELLATIGMPQGPADGALTFRPEHAVPNVPMDRVELSAFVERRTAAMAASMATAAAAAAVRGNTAAAAASSLQSSPSSLGGVVPSRTVANTAVVIGSLGTAAVEYAQQPPDNDFMSETVGALSPIAVAVYLCDAIEYSLGALLRVAMLPNTHGELASRPVLTTLVSLLSMHRPSLRNAASRLVYIVATSEDPPVVAELLAQPEYLAESTRIALRQCHDEQDSASNAPPPGGAAIESSEPFAPRRRVSTTVDFPLLSATTAKGAPPAAQERTSTREQTVTVTSPLPQLAARALLSLSTHLAAVPLMVHASAGDALMHLYRDPDPATRRWALLSLCNLFELCEDRREELLELGFLPVMVETVNKAIARADAALLASQKQGIGKFLPAPTVAVTGTLDSARQTAAASEHSAVGTLASVVATAKMVDRFADADAATSCALAVCALSSGSVSVVRQVLQSGALETLKELARAACILLRDGLLGLGGAQALPPRTGANGGVAAGVPGEHGVPALPSSAADGGQDSSFSGVPLIWLPKVLAAAVAAVASIASRPACHALFFTRTAVGSPSRGNYTQNNSAVSMLQLLVDCVPPKPYLSGTSARIAPHVTDAALAEWGKAERSIQVAAVAAINCLCTSRPGLQEVASHGSAPPSAVEILARVAGAVPTPALRSNGQLGMSIGDASNARTSGQAASPMLAPAAKPQGLATTTFRTQTKRNGLLSPNARGGNFSALRDAGAHTSVQAQAPRDRPKAIAWDEFSRELCVRSLSILTAFPAVHETIVCLGCVSVFTAHIRHVHSQMRRECAHALYSLSCTALSSSGTSSDSSPAVDPGGRRRLSSDIGLHVVSGVAFDSSRDSGLTPDLMSESESPSHSPPQRDQQSSPISFTRQQVARAGYAFTGLNRVSLMLDADVSAALTIGSLFRADDDVTRDLCAAALFNLLALTYLLAPTASSPVIPQQPPSHSQALAAQELSTASSATSLNSKRRLSVTIMDDVPGHILATDNASSSAPPSSVQGTPTLRAASTIDAATSLRRKILADGVVWAVIKLTQGLTGNTGTFAPSPSLAERAQVSAVSEGRLMFGSPKRRRSSAASAVVASSASSAATAVQAASTRLLQGRHMVTCRLLRNLAIDDETASELSKRHAIDMLLWFARQCAAVVEAPSAVQEGASRLADGVLEDVRTAVPTAFGSSSNANSNASSALIFGQTAAGTADRKSSASPRRASRSPPRQVGAVLLRSTHVHRKSSSQGVFVAAAAATATSIAPELFRAVAQVATLLSSHQNCRKKLVGHGLLLALAKVTDVAVQMIHLYIQAHALFLKQRLFQAAVAGNPADFDSECAANKNSPSNGTASSGECSAAALRRESLSSKSALPQSGSAAVHSETISDDGLRALRLRAHLSVFVIHRVSLAVYHLAADETAVSRMVRQGPLCMAIISTITNAVSMCCGNVASPISEDQAVHSAAAFDVRNESIVEEQALLSHEHNLSQATRNCCTPLRILFRDVLLCVAISVVRLSAVNADTNVIGAQGALPWAYRLANLCAGSLLNPNSANAVSAILDLPASLPTSDASVALEVSAPPLPLSAALVDSTLRIVANCLGNANNAAAIQIAAADASDATFGTALPQSIERSDEPSADSFDAFGFEPLSNGVAAKDMVLSMLRATHVAIQCMVDTTGTGLITVGQPSNGVKEVISANHVQAFRITSAALVATAITCLTASGDISRKVCLSLHDPLLLSLLVQLARSAGAGYAGASTLREGLAISICNIVSASPSRFVPRAVLVFVTELLVDSQRPRKVPSIKELQSSAHSKHTGSRIDALLSAPLLPASEMQLLQRRLCITSLDHTATSALLRTMSMLLHARASPESRVRQQVLVDSAVIAGHVQSGAHSRAGRSGSIFNESAPSPQSSSTGFPTPQNAGHQRTFGALGLNMSDQPPTARRHSLRSNVQGADARVAATPRSASAPRLKRSSSHGNLQIATIEAAQQETVHGGPSSGTNVDSPAASTRGAGARGTRDKSSTPEAPSAGLRSGATSLATLKQLIDREHEEAARKSRTGESPHLRSLVAAGAVAAIACAAINCRRLLKTNMQLSLRRGPSAGALSRKPSVAAFKEPPAATAASSNGAPPTPQIAPWWSVSESSLDESRFLAVQQYLAADCLLVIAQSPDCTPGMFGRDIGGPSSSASKPWIAISGIRQSQPLHGGSPLAAAASGNTGAASCSAAATMLHDMVETVAAAEAAAISSRRVPADWKLPAGVAVTALSALAKCGRIAVQRMAAKALSHLTETHALRVSFVQEGGMAVLAALARHMSRDRSTQQWCATGLRNLSDDMKLRSSGMLEAGGVVQGVMKLLPSVATEASLYSAAGGSPRRQSISASTPSVASDGASRLQRSDSTHAFSAATLAPATSLPQNIQIPISGGISLQPGSASPSAGIAILALNVTSLLPPALSESTIALCTAALTHDGNEAEECESVWSDDDRDDATTDGTPLRMAGPIPSDSWSLSLAEAPQNDGQILAEYFTMDSKSQPAAGGSGTGGTLPLSALLQGMSAVPLSLSLFALPCAWRPRPSTLPRINFPVAPHPVAEACCASITGSAQAPDKDLQSDWSLPTGMMGFPDSCELADTESFVPYSARQAHEAASRKQQAQSLANALVSQQKAGGAGAAVALAAGHGSARSPSPSMSPSPAMLGSPSRWGTAPPLSAEATAAVTSPTAAPNWSSLLAQRAMRRMDLTEEEPGAVSAAQSADAAGVAASTSDAALPGSLSARGDRGADAAAALATAAERKHTHASVAAGVHEDPLTRVPSSAFAHHQLSDKATAYDRALPRGVDEGRQQRFDRMHGLGGALDPMPRHTGGGTAAEGTAPASLLDAVVQDLAVKIVAAEEAAIEAARPQPARDSLDLAPIQHKRRVDAVHRQATALLKPFALPDHQQAELVARIDATVPDSSALSRLLALGSSALPDGFEEDMAADAAAASMSAGLRGGFLISERAEAYIAELRARQQQQVPRPGGGHSHAIADAAAAMHSMPLRPGFTELGATTPGFSAPVGRPVRPQRSGDHRTHRQPQQQQSMDNTAHGASMPALHVPFTHLSRHPLTSAQRAARSRGGGAGTRLPVLTSSGIRVPANPSLPASVSRDQSSRLQGSASSRAESGAGLLAHKWTTVSTIELSSTIGSSSSLQQQPSSSSSIFHLEGRLSPDGRRLLSRQDNGGFPRSRQSKRFVVRDAWLDPEQDALMTGGGGGTDGSAAGTVFDRLHSRQRASRGSATESRAATGSAGAMATDAPQTFAGNALSVPTSQASRWLNAPRAAEGAAEAGAVAGILESDAAYNAVAIPTLDLTAQIEVVPSADPAAVAILHSLVALSADDNSDTNSGGNEGESVEVNFVPPPSFQAALEYGKQKFEESLRQSSPA